MCITYAKTRQFISNLFPKIYFILDVIFCLFIIPAALVASIIHFFYLYITNKGPIPSDDHGWQKQLFGLLFRVHFLLLGYHLSCRRHRFKLSNMDKQWELLTKAFYVLLGSEFEPLLRALLGEPLPEPFKHLLEKGKKGGGKNGRKTETQRN